MTALQMKPAAPPARGRIPVRSQRCPDEVRNLSQEMKEELTMKTTQRIIRTAVMALVALWMAAFVKPAFAEITTNAGTVRARGSGEIWSYGQGEVRFNLIDDGKLIVRNIDENRVTSSGYGTRLVDGPTVTFVSYRGTVTIKGDKIAAYYDGGQTEFEAYGDQRLILSGQGTYTIGDGDAADWEDYGTTITMGSPAVAEEDMVWGESAQYEAQTVGAAREIQSFPDYRTWAVQYPEAAVELVQTRDYYFWCSVHPVAVAALYDNPHWSLWVATRPRLVAFVNYHNVFFVWYDSHPVFRPYFHHPVFYHAFLHQHPAAFVGVSVDITIGDWSRRHPVEARTLETHVVIQNKLVVKNKSKTVIKGNAPNVHDLWQGRTAAQIDQDLRGKNKVRVDLNNDSRIDKNDKKLAGDVRDLLKKQDKKGELLANVNPQGRRSAELENVRVTAPEKISGLKKEDSRKDSVQKSGVTANPVPSPKVSDNETRQAAEAVKRAEAKRADEERAREKDAADRIDKQRKQQADLAARELQAQKQAERNRIDQENRAAKETAALERQQKDQQDRAIREAAEARKQAEKARVDEQNRAAKETAARQRQQKDQQDRAIREAAEARKQADKTRVDEQNRAVKERVALERQQKDQQAQEDRALRNDEKAHERAEKERVKAEKHSVQDY